MKDADFNGVFDELGDVGEPEFGEDMGAVGFDGSRAD